MARDQSSGAPRTREWSVLFGDGHRLVLSEAHARAVADHQRASLCSRLADEWTEIQDAPARDYRE